jgi:hypothetical protein
LALEFANSIRIAAGTEMLGEGRQRRYCCCRHYPRGARSAACCHYPGSEPSLNSSEKKRRESYIGLARSLFENKNNPAEVERIANELLTLEPHLLEMLIAED